MLKCASRTFWALLSSILILSNAPRAGADGYLWLGSEFQGEGNVYRYNIGAGAVDLVVSPSLPGGAAHWNNVAFDGANLLFGNPTTQYIGFADPHTGVVGSSSVYSPELAGHKEDGAYNPGTGRIWRMTYSGLLHELTPAGALVQTYSIESGLVGLEWAGGSLYSTNYSAANPANVGVVSFPGGANATFTIIPWAPGAAPPGGSPGDWGGALAYDPTEDKLYLVTYSSTRLFTVSFAAGEAYATLVTTLKDVGYVAGGLVDGMGWVPLTTAGVGEAPLVGGLEVVAVPNPFRREVELRVTLPAAEAISVIVADATGRAVRSIAGAGEQGMNAFRWDGRDDAGQDLPAGVYFAQIEAGELRWSGKLSLLR